jgi:hypothetical protein
MQFFVSISSKIDFIQRTMSIRLHRLIRASMGSFPAVFVAPSRNKEYLDTFLYTLQRWSLVPIGDQHFAAQSGVLSHPHFLGMGPSRWSKPITVPSRDHAYPPFCGSNFGLLPLPVYRLVVTDLGMLAFHRQRVTPYRFLIMHRGNTGLGTLPPLLPQSIIDHQNREFIRGNPPIPKLRTGRRLLWNGRFVDMHEGKDTADSSIPFQTLWLTVFYGTRITSDIGY